MCPLKPEHMSGGGTLQQRTTYLISLTLVKVEAVEEDGGEARRSTQGKEVEVAAEGWPEEKVKVEAEGSAPVWAENGAGACVGPPQRAQDAGAERQDEHKGGERRPLSCRKDKRVCEDAARKDDVSVPSAAEKTSIQKTKSADTVETSVPTPSHMAASSKETMEPSRTPTRTSLPLLPAGQHPVSLLKSHSSVTPRGRNFREGRDHSPTSAQSLDRKECRMATRSPGPCRASWAEVSRPEDWRDLRDEADFGMPLEVGGDVAAVLRDIPRKDRLKTGSTSLPAPATQVPKPARKGKSRTLDNSDLNSLSEDLGLSREAQQAKHGQRGSAKDRKMLKFISGIFTKSSSGVVGPSSTTLPVYIQRDSSEEEGRRSQPQHLSPAAEGSTGQVRSASVKPANLRPPGDRRSAVVVMFP